MSNEKDMTQDMGSRMIIENNIFPRWEHNIPSLGTKHSQTGNKMGLRLALNDITSRAPRHYVSCLTTFLRPFSSKRAEFGQRLVVTLLLMMVVGVSGVKADGYEGVYYLSGNNQGKDSYDVNNTTTNYYLCPTEDWIFYQATNNFTTTDNGQPFLTTYQYRNGTNDYTKAVWVIKKHPTLDYYYIIHAKDGKYMTSNDGITGSNSANRIRVHLEGTNSPTDNMLFNITKPSFYDISPKNNSGWYLNITQGNRASLQGTSDKADGPSYTLNGSTTRNVGGTIGLWNQGGDYTSKWYFEDAKAALTPTISDINAANNTFTITSGFVPTGCSIVYTTDGSDPSIDTSTTPATINGTVYSGPVTVTESITVKAAVIGYDMVLSNIDSKSLSPVITAPTVTNNGDGTISLSTVTSGTTIYYTTNGDTPDNNSTPYNNTPFSLGNATVIKAIAYLGSDFSEVTTYNVPQFEAPAISFNSATSQVTITYGSGGTVYYNIGDGTQTAPTASSTTYSTPFTVSSATTVKAIATHAGYLTSDVATLAIDQVAKPTITINADNSVTIACATDGATIYYKTGGDDPTTANGTQSTSIANILPSQGPIKAFAIKDGLINSNIATESNIPVKTITVSSTNGSLTSADPIVYNGNAHQPAFSITDGETTISSGEYTSTYSNNTNAGTATITIADNANGDYNVSGSFTFTIGQKALTITANDKEITYGDQPANGGVTYSGFIGGESENTEGMFIGTLSYAYSYSQYGDVGNTYTITPSGLTATNYAITFTPGTLTVNPKEVGLVWSETAFVYNGSEQAPTATATGTVNSDVIGVTVTGAQTNAGDYIATASELTGAKVDNYVLPDANTYAFTIGKKAMTVAADAKTKSYGDPDPELTYTSVGLVEGDELTGALARDEGENAGTYAITQGTLNNSNYTITYTGATFTITPKSLGDDTDPDENITIEITEADAEHVVVKQGGKELTPGTDYTITTTGSASTKYFEVTIEGKNNYKGSFTTKFATVTFGTNDNNHYWGTFVSNNNSDGDFAVPSNMEAYIVTSINASAGTVEVVPLDNIPEGEPVLLLSTVNANGFIVKTKNDGTDPTVTNLLKVESSAKSVTTAEIYLLYKGEFVLNAEGTLPAGKIYLSKPGGSSAPARLHIVRSQSTGIDNPQLSTPNSQLSGIWYTLDGRRLSGKPSKKGLYLQNGKKMVVR